MSFRLRPAHFIIPLITVATAVIGSMFTTIGPWYRHLAKPAWTPPGSVIGTVWTEIFILSAISAIILWQKGPRRNKNFSLLFTAFCLNACLNVFWSALFFGWHLIGLAVIEAFVLWLSVLLLMVLARKSSKTATWLLLPYLLWTAFATYLTFIIWRMNSGA